MALEDLKEYLLSEETEEQKRPLIYKYFGELFKKEFHAEKRKSIACWWMSLNILSNLK